MPTTTFTRKRLLRMAWRTMWTARGLGSLIDGTVAVGGADVDVDLHNGGCLYRKLVLQQI